MYPELKNRLCLLVTVALLLGINPLQGLAQQYSVTVSSGGFDRSGTIVSFPFPDDVSQGVYHMKSSSSDPVPLQVDNNSTGWFVLDSLSSGSSRTYTLSADSSGEIGNNLRVQYKIDQNTISFRSGTHNVLSYFYKDNNPLAALDERYKRGGYIHPVYSPDGVTLTNHLNTDLHPHHLGIWSAWTSTEFQGRTPDFWNFQDNTGRVEAGDSLYAAWEGPVYGGFKAKHFFVDRSAFAPVIALNEEWEVRVYSSGDDDNYLIFDLIVTQTANTAQPLKLPEYRYGGIGFRGHADWDNPENITFLTSEGLGREGHATRARWCHIGGFSDGDLAGITVMDHPQNFRHPQPMRIHPDMAFFNYAPEQLGDMSIEPGSPYVARYRFVTYDGEPNPDELDRLWNDYAYPPGVTVERIRNEE